MQKYRNILICRKYIADNNETDDDIGIFFVVGELRFLGSFECVFGSEGYTRGSSSNLSRIRKLTRSCALFGGVCRLVVDVPDGEINLNGKFSASCIANIYLMTR